MWTTMRDASLEPVHVHCHACVRSSASDPCLFPQIHSSFSLMVQTEHLCLSQQNRMDTKLQLLGGNGETSCKR